jgi:hypothetical protein
LAPPVKITQAEMSKIESGVVDPHRRPNLVSPLQAESLSRVLDFMDFESFYWGDPDLNGATSVVTERQELVRNVLIALMHDVIDLTSDELAGISNVKSALKQALIGYVPYSRVLAERNSGADDALMTSSENISQRLNDAMDWLSDRMQDDFFELFSHVFIQSPKGYSKLENRIIKFVLGEFLSLLDKFAATADSMGVLAFGLQKQIILVEKHTVLLALQDVQRNNSDIEIIKKFVQDTNQYLDEISQIAEIF